MSPALLMIVTALSLVLAAVMSAIAWRVSRAERRRAEARIAVLSAEIHEEGSLASVAAAGGHRAEVGIRAEPPRRYPSAASAAARWPAHDLPLRDVAKAAAPSPELFTGARPESTATRIVATVALGIFVVAALAALAIVFSSAWQPSSDAAVLRSAAAVAESAPLELVRLSHERQGDQLTVTGVVHNPASGARIDSLDAVVVVYDRDGTIMTSARAPVERTPLSADGQSPFAVTIPDAAAVGRYRVSFRVGDRAIAHVDRRGRGDEADAQGLAK
jgi:hypothetical protein